MSEAKKHHGMLFADRLMPSMLDGSKTQTRRPIQHQPKQRDDGVWEQWYSRSKAHCNKRFEQVFCNATGRLLQTREYQLPVEQWLLELSPYHVGDLIWCRETWAEIGDEDEAVPRSFVYRADGGDYSDWESVDGDTFRWRPSIHMPKWACRCWKEITEVRVERACEISAEDAMAEGIKYINGRFTFNNGMAEFRTARDAFKAAWESIYPDGWESWCWALTFQPTTAPLP